MNDYEKLKKCFDEIGIEYKEWLIGKKEPWITLYSPFNEDVVELIFDESGKYKEMH